MAEGIIDTPITHEKHIVEESATDVHHHKQSIVSLPTGGSSRRKSGSPQNVVPNYLRTSTGSCHDFCKYGKKHAIEEKPWKKKPVRKGTPATSPSNSLDSIQINVAGESKKENVARMSLEAKTCSLKENALSSEKSRLLRKSCSPVKKTPSSEPPEVIKRVITSPSQEMEVLEKSSSSTGGKGLKTERKTNDSLEKRVSAKSKVNKVKPLSSSIDSDSGKGEIDGSKGSRTEEKTDHSSEKRASAKSKLVKVKQSSSSVDSDGKDGKEEIDGGKGSKPEEKTDHISEKRAPAKSKLTKVKLQSSSVDSDGGKNGKGEIDGGKGSKTDEKTDHKVVRRAPAKSKLTKVKPLSSVDSDGKNGKGEINGLVKTEKKILVPKASTKKALSPIASTSSPRIRHTRTSSFDGKKAGSLKLASLVKDRNKIRMAGAKISKNEKTLHVVKVEIGSSTKSSPQIKDVEAKQNSKKTPRSRLVPAEDKYRSPLKLQFRSGKVVELRSDNNTPRRLKFRRTRAPGGEDGKSEVTKKSLSKAGANADVSGADILSRKVVLKRQVVQGKKVARVLLNNVIEETASKLVESRKSKVKALVGAFETVISLHEVKSSRTVKSGGE